MKSPSLEMLSDIKKKMYPYLQVESIVPLPKYQITKSNVELKLELLKPLYPLDNLSKVKEHNLLIIISEITLLKEFPM